MEEPAISDRAVLWGILSAVGALAERLTGDTLSVRLDTSDGSFVWIGPLGTNTAWTTA